MDNTSITYLLLILLVLSIYIAFIIIKKVKENMYGKVIIPDDIIDLQRNIATCDFIIEHSDFKVINSSKNHRHLSKEIHNSRGVWALDIEMKNNEVIGFEAKYKSKESIFLNRTIHKTIKQTKFVAIFSE